MSPSPHNRVDVEVEHLEARPVEIRRQPLARRSPCRRCCPRPAPAARWWFRRQTYMRFRMPRRPAVQLPETLDVVQRNREFVQDLVLWIHPPHFGQVQHRVKQHRGVAVRKHEAVAIRPDRIGGIVAQELLPQSNRRPAPGPSARPDGPEFACCTASMASVRIVLMQSVSSCCPVTKTCSLATMRLVSQLANLHD